ncbi:leucine-rich repeats and immunoglobulin-like domains protein 1 isoform X2 [Mytilus californianus]|uniref:leucine-rich repeats and immunoglobulin-like domains protein 1 isoform X2 n=1 Tax=Mytilus californianus TaxID=6549 RepID=UPI002247D58E|nr:leucine-rich repeats and immunoglobulin-like domains protein 1 isoform X2 [Mytilus californianus]
MEGFIMLYLSVTVSAIRVPIPVIEPSTNEVIWRRISDVHPLTIGQYVFTSDSRISIQHATGTNDWNLIITDVKPGDAGEYECQVSAKNTVRRMVLLNVNAVNENIRFIKKPSDVWVEKGKFARFECSATGRSSPIISWSKDGVDDFPAAQERRMYTIVDSDDFFILGVTINDAGVYTCTATTVDGSISTDVNLIVLNVEDASSS